MASPIESETTDPSAGAQSNPNETGVRPLVRIDPNDPARGMVIHIANVTGSAALYSIYWDPNGTTFSTSTALAYQISIAANSAYPFVIGFEMNSGIVAVQSSVAGALTFTAGKPAPGIVLS